MAASSHVNSTPVFVEVDLVSTEKKLMAAKAADPGMPTFGLMVMFRWLESLSPGPNLPQLGQLGFRLIRARDDALLTTLYTLAIHVSKGQYLLKKGGFDRGVAPVALSAGLLDHPLQLTILQQSRQAMKRNSRHTSKGFLWGHSKAMRHVVVKESHPFWLSLSFPFQLLCRHSPSEDWRQLAATPGEALVQLPPPPPSPSPPPSPPRVAHGNDAAEEEEGHPCTWCKLKIERLRRELRHAEAYCRGRECLGCLSLESELLDAGSYTGEEDTLPPCRNSSNLH